jgi:hypothetical protein
MVILFLTRLSDLPTDIFEVIVSFVPLHAMEAPGGEEV